MMSVDFNHRPHSEAAAKKKSKNKKAMPLAASSMTEAMESSKSPTADRLGRVRRLKACKRCHVRRIKCDASITGPPCSNCRSAKYSDCSFIESRRLRGAAGRFVTTAGQEEITESHIPSPIARPTPSPSIAESRSLERAPSTTTTVQEVDIALDLAGLGQSGKHNDAVIVQTTEREQTGTSNNAATNGPFQHPHAPRYRKWAGFVGESWYASFLLRASNNDSAKLRQHIIYSPYDTHGESQEPGGANGELWQESSPEQLPDDLPHQDLISGLVEAYFARFHILFPILSKSEFQAGFAKGRVPIVLLRCVIFIGSVHCDATIIHRMGYSTRADAGDDLFNRAKNCVNEHPGEPRCIQITSSFLLHHWWGRPLGVKDPVSWLATAILLAQSLGMHRSLNGSCMAPASRAHWKRTWWCLYIRDRQVALSMGAPMIINDLECDIEELVREDFPDESEVAARYVMAQASLSRIVSRIYFSYLVPSRLILTKGKEYGSTAETEILATLDRWYKDLPALLRHERQGGHLTVLLRIVYNYYKIEISQRLRRLSPPPELQDYTDSLNCASNITRDLENSLLYWKPECFPMITIAATLNAMTIQYISSRSSHAHPDQKSLLIQKLRSNLISLRQFEECYVLARWIRNLFEDTLTRQWHSMSPCRSATQSPSPSQFNEEGSHDVVHGVVHDPSIGSPTDFDHVMMSADHPTAFDLDFFYMPLESEEQMMAGFLLPGNLHDSQRSAFMGDLPF